MPVLLLKNQKKNVGKLEICNQTEISADLNIFGDIVSDDWGKWCDDDTCPSDISDFLKNLEDIQEINLHINSGGGSVFAGITIYNKMCIRDRAGDATADFIKCVVFGRSAEFAEK